MTLRRSSPRAGARWSVLFGTVAAASVLLATAVLASHYQASLEGSYFEIDNDANFVNNAGASFDDWVDVTESRREDVATGQNDDSYKGGVKEDTVCPGETTGSIPNNKSDLRYFGVYEEEGDPGFLHMFWTRVSDPSGTTLMDFEFNQSLTACAQGPNVERTVDDILLEYSIDQGGSRATITIRKWTGSAWGPATTLDPSEATGTINSTPILAANSDGTLTSGSLSARTFGEASIDLDVIFDDTKCQSFGSAMLKSRSSDAFTSQLKDFIRPVPITLTNCGKVIIRKQTDPDGSTQLFDFSKSFNTDPSTTNTFQLADGGVKTYTGVLFGTGYTVAEGTLPSGWEFVGIDCNVTANPSVGVTPSITGQTITFSIDDEDDVLDCTYTNRARGSLKVVKQTDPSSNTTTTFTFTPTGFNGGSTFTLTGHNANQTFTNLVPGSSYGVSEAAVAGWDLTAASCTLQGGGSTGTLSGSAISSITVEAGKQTTCTFSNRQRGQINIHKQDNLGTALSGVTFTVYVDVAPLGPTTPRGTGDTTVAGSCTTDASGDCSVTDLVPGPYWVVEGTPPAGHQAAPDQHVNLGAGATVSLTFVNNRIPATINIVKRDDDNPTNPLAGAVFTLYVNNAPTAGPRGAEDTITTKTCTTSAAGTCQITGVEPGSYWVVETTTPAGYDTAADQAVSLVLAQTVTLTFDDPRDFKVIVFVCQESNGQLYASSVTFQDGTKTTLATGALPAGITESVLCALSTGAVYDDLSFGSYNDDDNGVNIPQ